MPIRSVCASTLPGSAHNASAYCARPIGSFAGAPVNPAWVHNLRANPQAHVEVGLDSGIDAFDVTARELPVTEREDLFPKLTAEAPGFAEYQSKTSRVIPLFELQRT